MSTTFRAELVQAVVDSLDVFIEPPAPEIGSTIGRIGMPVRYEDRLLGFIGRNP